ncbi:MAG: ATP-binding protein [Muribaculaceae bacterium]|nr:ATP-binding protein [Muribaculaceae bacterium]
MANIKYPIGIQSFRKLIEGDYLYVDKTAEIHDLVNSIGYVFLSRPRRFGKSLLMSTIEAYFKGERELFRGLKIDSIEKEWTSYPVFRFDLSGENFDASDKLIAHIHRYLDRFEEEYGVRTDGSISQRFTSLIYEVKRFTGKKIVILVDEYDKPLLDCLHDTETHSRQKAELHGFYSVIKANDDYIRFAMLSGITKFSQVSIFSGINNLKDISMLPRFNTICGISESEFHIYFSTSISIFAHEHGISEEKAWHKFKAMYDGYRFAAAGECIYNPFSVLNAFYDNDLRSYWFASGSPSYLVKLIETRSYSLNDLEGVRRSEIKLNDISDFGYDIVPLLYQSGYLTIKSYDPVTREYILGFPNREVSTSFWESLANHFFRVPGGRQIFDVREYARDINEGRPEDFMIRMKCLFADTNSEPETNKEIHFQNMMSIAAKMLGLMVRTEVHSSVGRCDMQILTDRYICIFEFKMNGSSGEALSQILKKGYAEPFSADPREKILIGANFLTDTRTLDSWIIRKF